jgi:hypothetical protein
MNIPPVVGNSDKREFWNDRDALKEGEWPEEDGKGRGYWNLLLDFTQKTKFVSILRLQRRIS